MSPWHADDTHPNHYDFGIVWWVVRDNEGIQYIGYRGEYWNAPFRRIVSASPTAEMAHEGDYIRVHRDAQSHSALALSINDGEWAATA
jgi:hypothetical protein